MISLAIAICKKDIRLALFRGSSWAQGLLLGLLLIFTFSLSRGPAGVISPEAAGAVFWLASVFCLALIFNQLYALEEGGLARLGLWLLPAPIQGIWLGKLLGGFALLLIMQAIFLPAAMIFLAQNDPIVDCSGFAIFFLVDVGLCAGGSLIGALGQAGRESLLCVLLFPLLMPLVLAGTAVGARFFGAETPEDGWLGLVCAFDAVFLGAGLLLFGFLYSEDE